VIDTTTVAYGEVPTHADPTKEADAQYTYTFAGWNTTPVAVTGNATYTATYSTTTNTYTITWKQDDGSVIDSTTVPYGTVPTHDDPNKASVLDGDGITVLTRYQFAGWGPDLEEVTADAEYTATYTAKYRVSFEMNGHGTAPDPQYVESGSYASEPNPAPKVLNYNFNGWYTDAECTNPFNFAAAPITAPTTLYAKWAAKLVGADTVVNVVIPDGSGITIYIYDGENEQLFDANGEITLPTGKAIQVKFVQNDAYIAGPATKLTAGTMTLAEGAHIDGVYHDYEVEGDATITLNDLYKVINNTNLPENSISGLSAIIGDVVITDAAYPESEAYLIEGDLYITETGSLTVRIGEYPTYIEADANLTNEGAITVSSGAMLSNSSTITIENSGTLTIENGGGLYNTEDGTIAIANGGTITNNSSGYEEEFDDGISNSGTISSGGTITNNQTFTNYGTVTVQESSSFINGTSGRLNNHGNFSGTVTNQGLIWNYEGGEFYPIPEGNFKDGE
jgi:uncharacterized repeat protein (TIGR02543 family)